MIEDILAVGETRLVDASYHCRLPPSRPGEMKEAVGVDRIVSLRVLHIVFEPVGPIGAPVVSERLRHFRTVLTFRQYWLARTRAGACAALSSARIRGVVRALP